MANAKDTYIHAYTLATLPLRKWVHWKLKKKSQVPVASIFLHRIADDYPNDWSMTNAAFDALIGWLEKNVDLVSLDDAQELLRTGNRGRMAVNITFDDGYADNCLHAIPTLLKKKIPFTYYVTTENVKTGDYFPHDVHGQQPLAPNTIEEIKAMSDAGVEIGAHTRTHPDMGTLDRLEDIRDEIDGSRETLEAWTGRRPKHFAFPYGLQCNLTPASIQHIYDAGFSSYCSAYGGYNFPFDGAFHIQRFHGDPSLARIRNWLSFDPRWIYTEPVEEYIPDRQKSHRETESVRWFNSPEKSHTRSCQDS